MARHTLGHWDSKPIPDDYNKANALSIKAHFLAITVQYEFNRQAALYLDVPGAKRFLIIGIQKKVPHEVWLFDATAVPAFMGLGPRNISPCFAPSSTICSTSCAYI